MKWENRDTNLIQDGHILLKEDPKKYMNYVAATPNVGSKTNSCTRFFQGFC